MKEKIISEIIQLEWEMFSSVKNVGGRAWCQEDPQTFRVMRASQAETWPEELLISYRDDLLEAKGGGRNLMTEKYARMMESTFPHEYRRLAESLPEVDKKTLDRIEEIVAVHLEWKIQVAEKYPALTGKSRTIFTREDSRGNTSFETYLRGELRTYSAKTIDLYYNYILKEKKRGMNVEVASLLNILKHYGFSSLEEAEKKYQSTDAGR